MSIDDNKIAETDAREAGQDLEPKKTSLARTIMKYLVPLFFTVGLCWGLFHSINFSEMMEIITTQCNFSWMILVIIISIFSHVFRAMRWRIQLRALGITPPLYVLIYSIFGTYAVNFVLPRLGEVWRTSYIANRQHAPFSTVFGSMVADRLSDTVTVFLLLMATFVLASSTLLSYLRQSQATYDAIVGLATSPWVWLTAAVIVALCIWFFTRKPVEGSMVWRLRQFVRGLWEGFAVIASMPGKGRWLLLTVMIWGCYYLQMYFAFYAFPFTAEVLHSHGALAALVVFVISSISMAVPSNGGIGPWQWAVIFGLGIYGVDRVSAGAFANLVMGTQTALTIVLGLITFAGIALDRKKTPQEDPTRQ